MAFNKKDPTDIIHVRPRFKLYSALNKEDVIKHLLKEISKDNSIVGKRRLDRVYFSAPQEEQHYWSPELQISVEEDIENSETILYCTLGPQQNVWLVFVFIYTVIGFFTFFGGMFALVKLQLGNPGWWLLLFPLAIILVLGVYLISYFGKKKGQEQSLHLLRFLYKATDNKEIIRK